MKAGQIRINIIQRSRMSNSYEKIVDQDTKVSVLKQEIADRISEGGARVSAKRIVIGTYDEEEVLKPDSTLRECGVTDPARLYWSIAPKKEEVVSKDSVVTPPVAAAEDKSFPIIVKTLLGTTYKVTCVPGIAITKLKDLVATASGVPAAEQRLIFAGEQLEDSKTITDYDNTSHNGVVVSGIKKDTVIHLMQRKKEVTAPGKGVALAFFLMGSAFYAASYKEDFYPKVCKACAAASFLASAAIVYNTSRGSEQGRS